MERESDPTDLLFVDTFPLLDARLLKFPNPLDKWICLLELPKFNEDEVELDDNLMEYNITSTNQRQREREITRRLMGIAWHGGLEDLDQNYHINQFAQKFFIREGVLKDMYKQELKKPRLKSQYKPLRPMVSALNAVQDGSQYLSNIQVILDTHSKTRSLEFLLGGLLGLLHAHSLEQPPPLPIRNTLRCLSWHCSHANFPSVSLASFEIGVALKGQLAITTDGTYLYVLTDNQVHKIGTLKSMPGVVHATYTPTEQLVCVAFFPAISKLVCLVEQPDLHKAKLILVDPQSMQAICSTSVDINSDLPATSCWLACNEFYVCYAVKDEDRQGYFFLQVSSAPGGQYTFSEKARITFSQTNCKSPKFQFWVSDKTLMFASNPFDGELTQIRLLNNKRLGMNLAHKDFSAFCVDLHNNFTWGLSTATNEGRVILYKNEGTSSVASDPSNFVTYLQSSTNPQTFTEYVEKFEAVKEETVDTSSALTHLFGFLDVKSTRFCSHEVKVKSAQDVCMEISQNIFRFMLMVLVETSKLAVPQLQSSGFPKEVMWLLSILKLLRVHFIRASDYNVYKAAVGLVTNDGTPSLATQIQKQFDLILEATSSGSTEAMKLVAREVAKAYTAGLEFFLATHSDRFKFIKELLAANITQPPENSKRILLEEMCDDVTKSLLFDSFVILSQQPDEQQPEQPENPEDMNPLPLRPLVMELVPITKGADIVEVSQLYKSIHHKYVKVLDEHSIANMHAILNGGSPSLLPVIMVKTVRNILKQVVGDILAMYRQVPFVIRVVETACSYLDKLQQAVQGQPITEELEQRILTCLEYSMVTSVVPHLLLHVNLLKECKRKFIVQLTKALKDFTFQFQSLLFKLPSIRAIEESLEKVPRNPMQYITTPLLTKGPRPDTHDTSFNISETLKFPDGITSVVAHFDAESDRGAYSVSEKNNKRYTQKNIPQRPILINDNEFEFNCAPAQRPVSGSRIVFVGYPPHGDALRMDHKTRYNTAQFVYDLMRFGSHLMTLFIKRLAGDLLYSEFEKYEDLFLAGHDNSPQDAPINLFIDQLINAKEDSMGDKCYRMLKGKETAPVTTGSARESINSKLETIDRHVLAVLLKHNNLIETAMMYAENPKQYPVVPAPLAYLWKSTIKMRQFLIKHHQDSKNSNPELEYVLVLLFSPSSDEKSYEVLRNMVEEDCKCMLRFAPKSHMDLKSFLEPHMSTPMNEASEPRKALKRSNTVLIEDNEPSAKKTRSLTRATSTSPLKNSIDGLQRTKSTIGPRALRSSMEIENKEQPEVAEPDTQDVKSLIRADSTMMAIHKWKTGAHLAPQVTAQCQKTCNTILHILQNAGKPLGQWVVPMQNHRAARKIEGYNFTLEALSEIKFPSMKNELLSKMMTVYNYRLDLQLVEGPPLLDVRTAFWNMLSHVMKLLKENPANSDLNKGQLLLMFNTNFSPLLDLTKLSSLGVIEFLFSDIQQAIEQGIHTKQTLAETKTSMCILTEILDTCLFGSTAQDMADDSQKYIDEDSYNALKHLLHKMQANSIEMIQRLIGTFIKKGFELHQQKMFDQRQDTIFLHFENVLYNFLQCFVWLIRNQRVTPLIGVHFVGNLLPLCALGSLRCSRTVFRVLRKFLPNTAPSALDDYLSRVNVTDGAILSPNAPLASLFNCGPSSKESLIEKLMVEIGNTIHLGAAYTSPLITTGRSYLSIQSELVMLVRLLSQSAAWKDLVLAHFSSRLSPLEQLLHGKSVAWTKDLASCYGALLVFGAHKDILRVGGRCKVNWEEGHTETAHILGWDTSYDVSYLYPHPLDLITLSEMATCLNAKLMIESSGENKPQTVECARLTPLTEIPANTSILVDTDVIPRLLELAVVFSRDVTSANALRSQAGGLITALLFNFFREPSQLNRFSTLIKKTGYMDTLMKIALENLPIEQDRYQGLDTPQLEDEMSSAIMQLHDMVCDAYQIAVPFLPKPPPITDCFVLPETTSNLQVVVPQESDECDYISYWHTDLFAHHAQLKPTQEQVAFLVKQQRKSQTKELKNVPGILFGLEDHRNAGVCFLDEETSLMKHTWMKAEDLVFWKGSLRADPRVHVLPFNPKLLMEQMTKYYQSLCIMYARDIVIAALTDPQLDLLQFKSPKDHSNFIKFAKLVIGKRYGLTDEKKKEMSATEKAIARMVQDLGIETMLTDEIIAFFNASPWTICMETPHPITTELRRTYTLSFPKAMVAYLYSDTKADALSCSLMGKDCHWRAFNPPSTLYYTNFLRFSFIAGPGYGYKLLAFPLGGCMVDRACISSDNTNFVGWLFCQAPEFFPELFAKMLNQALFEGLMDYCSRKGPADLYLTPIKCLTCAIHCVLDQLKHTKANSKHWFWQINPSKLEELLTLYLKRASREEIEICLALAKAKKLLGSKMIEKLKKKKGKNKKIPKPPPDNYPTWLPPLMGLSSDVLSVVGRPSSREVSKEWMNEMMMDLVVPLHSWDTPFPYPTEPVVIQSDPITIPGAEMLFFRFDERCEIPDTDSFVMGPDLENEVCFIMGGETNSISQTGKYSRCRGDTFQFAFEAKAPVHPNKCQVCQQNEGVLWNCLYCKTWLCSDHVDEHDASHVFAKYRRPRDNEPPLPVIPPVQWVEGQADHEGTQCEICQVSPITGTRYKCGYCGASICSNCEEEQDHPPGHVLIRLPKPVPEDVEDTLVHMATQQEFFGIRLIVHPVFSKEFIDDVMKKEKKKVAKIKKWLDGWTLEEDLGLMQFINELVSPVVIRPQEITEQWIQEFTTPSNSFLLDMPHAKIQARFAFLRHLNRHIESLLSFIPYNDTMSPVSLPWSLDNLLRQARALIFPDIKTFFMTILMAQDCMEQGKEIILNRALAEEDKGEGLFKQAFWQMECDDYSYLRMTPDLPAFKATFLGEGSEDVGGPFGEAVTTIFMEIQSETPSRQAFFIPCPNNTTEVGLNRDKVVPNPSMNTQTFLSAFKFIGALLAVCFRCSVPCPLNLPSLFWKKFVGEKPDRADLLAIDQTCIQSLDSLINIEQEGITKEKFSDAISFTFTTTTSDGRKVSLIEGGADIPVTWENRHEYVRLVEEFKLSEFDRQIKVMLAGFTSVMGSTEEYFTLCSWEEIELRICGKPEIDLAMLKQNTAYHGFAPTDDTVEDFWAAMESFSQEELGAFVRFTSGRTRLPHEWQRSFTLTKMRVENPDNYLPTAHTCFFQLELPEYSSFDILRAKLHYAITECKAIDLDFRVRDDDI